LKALFETIYINITMIHKALYSCILMKNYRLKVSTSPDFSLKWFVNFDFKAIESK